MHRRTPSISAVLMIACALAACSGPGSSTPNGSAPGGQPLGGGPGGSDGGSSGRGSADASRHGSGGGIEGGTGRAESGGDDATVDSESWEGILDPSRAIDWSSTGIPGGIPNRATVCATVNASTYGNGASDATAGIQAALNGCPANQVVMLSAGTFLVNSEISVPSNVTLRGAGAQATVLNANGATDAVISFGSPVTPQASSSVAITGGATAGSTSVTLANAGGISVGSYLLVTELNDSSFVSIAGSEGSCTWCDGGIGWNGTRVRGQIVEVTSVSGTTVGISPLYSAYTLTPLATPFTAGAKYAGVENLQVYANNTGYSATFLMSGSAYCWIKGVEDNYADADHVDAFWSYRGEIRDSYFSNDYLHTPGSSDSDVFIAEKTSGFLVENNILERLHASIMLNWGAAGNVIAYNYATGNFDSGATNVLMVDLSMHGAHPQFNLFEGNVAAQLHPDSIWGSSSHNTAFRNWIQGTTLIANPTTGRGTVDWAGAHWAIQANRAIDADFLTSSWNYVGDVVGSSDMANLHFYNGPTPLPQVAMTISPSNRSYDDAAYGYSFGYGEASDSGDSSFECGSPCVPYTTAFLHGEFNNVNGTITWAATPPAHTLPASFYRSSKPSWFGSVPWPPIGPDVTGGLDAGGHANPNPAMVCYTNTAKDAAGMLTFDPTKCY
jgi:hypothetical protein